MYLAVLWMICDRIFDADLGLFNYSNLSNNRAGANNRAQGKSSGDIVSCRQQIIVLRGIFYNFHIMYISPK